MNPVVQTQSKLRILIRRRNALGDVLLTTPIIRRLRLELGPETILDVATLCPEVYHRNPYINYVYKWPHTGVGYGRIINLDLCYERSPSMHIIDAYSREAFGDLITYDKSTCLFPSSADDVWAESVLNSLGVARPKCIVVNMSQAENIRNWPRESWRTTLCKIVEMGFSIIVVGSDNDFAVSGPGIFDLSGGILHEFLGNTYARFAAVHIIKKLHLTRIFAKLSTRTTIQQLSALIGKCGCFLSSDSGLLHVAGTTSVPIVGIFTSIKGEYRIPYRNGAYGTNCRIVRPGLDCYGCRELLSPPVTQQQNCQRGDYLCKKQVTVEMVVSAVVESMRQNI